jgi:UDP-N-acetylglucosamine acyltransferase
VELNPTAIISSKAEIAPGVKIGPYSTIGDNVKLGKNTVIEANVHLVGYTEIGEGCHIYPFCSLGTPAQDLKYKGEKTYVRIGDRNVFREFTTVNAGTGCGPGETVIGNDNYFMAYSHIAHDCIVGNGVIFGNGGTLAGHVVVEDYAIIGAFSGVHQFCKVGKHGFIGGYSVITKDVLPFSKTVGNRAKAYGINYIGLKRRNFLPAVIEKLRKAFRLLLNSNLNTSQAIAEIEKTITGCEEVAYLVEFVKGSRRGVIK